MRDLLVGEVKSIDGSDPNGEFEVVLSAPTVDRDGEVVEARCFEPLPDHITFDIDHGMSVATTVGSGVPFYDGDLLKVKGVYSSIPRAQEVRTLVREGHIRTTSVAFMGAKREVKDGVPHIISAELLNGAFVPIPSNREAAVLVSKGVTAQRVTGLKAVEGSYEDLRERITHAVRAAHPEAWWVYVLATFADHVIYEIEGQSDTVRLSAPYSTNDDGTIDLSAGEPVDVVEVVQPAKSADADDTKSTDPEEEAAAPAAADPLAEVALQHQVRAEIARSTAALLRS